MSTAAARRSPQKASGRAAATIDGGVAVHLFTVDDYHRMIEAGILDEDDRVELLEGRIVEMTPIGPMHAAKVANVCRALDRLSLVGWHVRAQSPITLAASEPQPDVVVARGEPDDFQERHPGPADLGLVIEVADESLPKDRGLKLRAYAAAGIVEYWLVDLVHGRVEVYRDIVPSQRRREAKYANCRQVRRGGRIPVNLDGKKFGHITAGDLLPGS